jgi:Fe-S-cluster-containing dehydrogenase component/CRP-like cAMP-binding protein
MNEPVALMSRPQRWDTPFGPEMTDADVERLMRRPEFAAIKSENFPDHTPLAGILKNDARIVKYREGDLVVREGDYGNSAFLVLHGKLRVVLAPGLPNEVLGRQKPQPKSFWESLTQLWRNRGIAEVRRLTSGGGTGLHREENAAASHVFLQDIPTVLGEHKTAQLRRGALFGEIAALGRVPRTATVFAEAEAELVEIRWQGLREIRKFDEGWRRQIDESYRANALKAHLRATPLFAELEEGALQEIADHTLFETYGSFEWHVSYKKYVSQGQGGAASEPVIARQGDYPDGLLLVRAGFVRVSSRLGNGERTLTYLGAGDHFGLDELYGAWEAKTQLSLETSLTAVGYVDVLRVPTHILERLVFPNLKPPERRLSASAANRPVANDAVLDWLVDERFINGTKAMLIDLDRCTRCDDCVRACASTHDGNPRFLRQGRTFDHWMITNACMHCADPVCLIGCPTGAIHRSMFGGLVVINDDTCIGCSTCASSCPYENIRMVEINDARGKPILAEDQKPIVKATKCDLCFEQLGGPACVRACPHDALSRVDFKELDLFQMKETSAERNRPRYVIIAVCVLLLGVAYAKHRVRLSLGNPAPLTGWLLLLTMAGLAAYNGRKRLSMLPLAKSSTWLFAHVVGGFTALAFFWLHTGTLWPQGFYEQVLAALFYAVSLSGVVGHVLQRTYPRLLTNTRMEIIYERIPHALAEMRTKAEEIVLTCTRETGSDTLARHYLETLDWYFRQPRFFVTHAFGSEKARAWQRQQIATVHRYLNEPERKFLTQLADLTEQKTELDFHYAAQSVMKRWLFIHVPLAVAVLALSLWHVLVVYVYAR